MASKVIAEMAVRLGLDPAEFLEKMKGVQGVNAFTSAAMAREWKKTGRDGQEGLRLIDEAMGIHVARPVARIIAETLPGLSKALSSILGGVAGGAFGLAIFEFAEHIGKKMEEAKKKEEDYAEAVRHTETVVAEARISYEKDIDKQRAKLAELHKDTAAVGRFKAAEIDSESVETLAKRFNDVAEARRKEAEAAKAAAGFMHEEFLGWSIILHSITTSQKDLNIEKIDAQAKHLQETFVGLTAAGQFRDVASQVAYLSSALEVEQHRLEQMQQHAGSGAFAFAVPGQPAVQHYSTEEIQAQAAAVKWLKDNAKELGDQAKKDADLKKQVSAEEAGQRQAEQLKHQLEAVDRLTTSLQAKAEAEGMSTAAAEKGTQASIEAAAAAATAKDVADLQAKAAESFKGGDISAASYRKITAAIAAAQPAWLAANRFFESSKNATEYGHALESVTLQMRTHIATLDAEAGSTGRVAAEQAKQAEGLNRLRAQFGTSTALAPTIGPPSLQQSQLTEATKLLDIEQAKTQTSALAAELQKVAEQTQRAGSAGEKMAAEFQKIVRETGALPRQFGQIIDALAMAQEAKGWDSLDQLKTKLKEAQAESKALADSSPFPKIEAEIQKLLAEGMLPRFVDQVRGVLEETERSEAIGKAFGGVDSLNAGGAKMQELQMQMTALSRAASSGRTDDGTALSPTTLAAVKLQMQDIREEMDKLALKTADVGTGFKAWLDSLKLVASSGQQVFDLLTSASKGAEDAAAKTLVDMVENIQGSHRKLIDELKKMWESFFAGLVEMAAKAAMQKVVAQLMNSMAPKAAAGASAGTGTGGLFGMLFDLFGKGGGSSAGGGLVGGVGDIGAYAEGGDVGPGQSFISGEEGAERVDLNPSGAKITPMRGGSGGGDTHHYYDLRGAVVTDDLVRKADAARMSSETENRAVQRSVAMTQDIALRGRPSR